MDKSSWSIIQWLPNEVLSEVLRFCAPRELAILLRVAKLFNEIGLPLLYRDLYLDISQAKLASALSFRVSIERDPARALMIKAIRIIALDLANIEAVASIMEGIKNFTTIVPAIVQLTNIEVFRIVCEFDEEGLLDLLDVAFFPKMHTLTLAFSGLLHPSQISPFINRHPTLRSVSLQSNSVFGDNFSVFLSAFPRIELLEHMSAPFEYFLGDIPSKNLTSASIDFSVYGRPEIGRTFVSLANSAAKDSCKTLVCTTQGSYAPLMEYISGLMPKIENLTIRSGPLPRFASFDELAKFKHLKKFTHITVDKDDDGLQKAIDRVDDQLFHGMSSTLSLLKLYGTTWSRTNDGWIRTKS